MFQFEIEETAPIVKQEKTNEVSIETCLFNVGDKIICENHTGELKYIGPVNSYAGIWLGIEWDNPRRGKHSGSVDGVVYFNSSKSNAASFIRPPKAKKVKSIIEALNERYGYDHEVMSSLKDIENRLEKRKVEFSKLKIIDLCSRGVYDLGVAQEVADLCPIVEFLDISANLITSWTSIAQLCRNLARLYRLDISQNKLSMPSDEELLSVQNSFPVLQHLILGKVAYDWAQIIRVSTLWCDITNLQVQYNCISVISPPSNTLLNLTNLDLEGNQIEDWDEVIKLSTLEKLEYMNLCGNKITNIQFLSIHDEKRKTPVTNLFPSLARLNLSENAIHNWASISELNKLMSLTELRTNGNPLMDKDTRINNRQGIIARIGNLQKFEGGAINREDRRDAELDYLNKFASNWNLEGTDIKFCIEHPRYAELVDKLGQSDVPDPKFSVKTMRCNLITLLFKPEDSNLQPCQKKILHSMNVQKLKALLKRVYKTPTAPVELKLISLVNPGLSYVLENDFFDLSQYSVEDGDTIVVHW